MASSFSRRSLLLSGAATATSSFSQTRTQQRPNILWILAEDMSPQLSCYGEPLVQTPNIDRLASQGTRFQHAFTTAPVCSASRSALATGVFQTTVGAHQHRTIHKNPLPSPVKHFCEYLHEAGYYTVLSAPKPGERKPGEGTGAAGAGKTDYNFVPPEKVFDGRDWSTRPAGQPFFAQLTLQESHKGVGWPLGRKLTPRIDPAKLKLPPYYPDHPVARDEYANYLEAIQLVDVYVGQLMDRLEQEGIAENTLVAFMGDNGSCLFRGKQFLYEGGIRVPLIVRWPGKVKSGAVNEGLISGVDVTAAILAAAGLNVPAHLHGRNFLAPDAQPRIHIFAARDRCDIASERMRCVRDDRYKYIRNYLPAIPYMQANPYKEKEYPTWNLVKDLHRQGKLDSVQSLFVADHKPVEELYDLQSDPHEVKNLASDPQHRTRLLAMRTLVDDWVRETNDQGGVMEDPVEIYNSFFKRA